MRPGIKLFRLFGIDVFLHWSWIIVAVVELQVRKNHYTTMAWNVAEYLSLFAIVLMHEFGHALACRSVGGVAHQIVLWPLGGVAYVSPPPRAGAQLWSIAAGPLVNVLLLPVTIALLYWANRAGLSKDAQRYVESIAYINGMLLAFNLLPVYPLDGGQIVRSLLWFIVGRARSLQVAAIIGLIGTGALGLLLLVYLREFDFYVLVMLAFLATRAWAGLVQSNAMLRVLNGPRRLEARCPGCYASPPVGPHWMCNCGSTFDAFELGRCPICGASPNAVRCVDCDAMAPVSAWYAPGMSPAGGDRPVNPGPAFVMPQLFTPYKSPEMPSRGPYRSL